MLREPRVFLEDILLAAVKVEKFTRGVSYDDFLDNEQWHNIFFIS